MIREFANSPTVQPNHFRGKIETGGAEKQCVCAARTVGQS